MDEYQKDVDRATKARWICSEAVAEMLDMPESWRFDPCSLWAALSRPSQPASQPAQGGVFLRLDGVIDGIDHATHARRI